jgi:hypothetical protein
MNIPQPAESINPYEYPFGYFDVQVQFAKKWAEIEGKPIGEVLFNKTALHRRLHGLGGPTSGWLKLMKRLDSDKDLDVSKEIFAEYCRDPKSLYSPDLSHGSFGFDFDPDTKVIKIHFSNPKRGQSPFEPDKIDLRKREFKALLQNIVGQHPDAKQLISASWLRSKKGYQSLFPSDRNTEISLMKPDMMLSGNSVWGQFIDASGNTNLNVYSNFIEAVTKSKTVEDLIRAFPYPAMLASDPIEMYYRYYGIEA